jgi:hypothetical protein
MEVAARPLGSCDQDGGNRPPPHLRPAALVRQLLDRGRGESVLPARIMGTSVAQIDATYGHLLPDSEDYLGGLLDSYDAQENPPEAVES